MSTPTPEQKIASEISSLQSRLGRLQDGVRLSRARDALEDTQTKIKGLPIRIKKLREAGYAFEKELETQAEDFVRQWMALNPSLVSSANQQAASLQAALRPLEAQMTQLAALKSNPTAARPAIDTLAAGMQMLEDKVLAAERQISGMYNTLNSQVSTFIGRLSRVEWMLTQLAEAKFTLRPTESGIMAVKAVWCKDVKERPEDPDGVLYLTDQRLIFEQKEEIATKKVLFITTAKEKVQALLWEAPVALVEDVKPSKQGMLKNEDHLDLRFGPSAPVQTVHLHIWQEGSEWVQLINRAKTRDFDQTRALKIDEAAQEKVESAPSQCPSCGANITQVVLRGMDSIKCEYCGYIIRL